mgnify:CR=1 FL=1
MLPETAVLGTPMYQPCFLILRIKKNSYKTTGDVKISNIHENGENISGYSGMLEFAKISGNYQYELGHSRSNDTYNINDLGYQNRNNLAVYWAEVSYRIFEPTNIFNEYNITLSSNFNYQNDTNQFAENNFELDFFFATKTRFAFGGEINTNLGDQYNFYEPRVKGRFFKQKPVYVINGWISTDYRKKFAIDIRSTYAKRYTLNNDLIEMTLPDKPKSSKQKYRKKV